MDSKTYNKSIIDNLINFVNKNSRITDKQVFKNRLQSEFSLKEDDPIYYCEHFAVRVAYSKTKNISNTIIALSRLKAYDHLPFFVIVVSPVGHKIVLANTSCIKKVSHSSQGLSSNKIVGSINYSDIYSEIGEIKNIPENFEALFDFHISKEFDDNLKRLVENTSNIEPNGSKFIVDDSNRDTINHSIKRAIDFIDSEDYKLLKEDLDNRVKKLETLIIIASMIDNVNLRGRVIEYLITGKEDELKKNVIKALKENSVLPEGIKTDNQLGDYQREFDNFNTETDIKTKILLLSSNPKGYNIDKLLQFLSEEKSVYMIYLIGINNIDNSIKLRLCSVYDNRLNIRIYNHWAGRNSRGEAQFDGGSLERIFEDESKTIINEKCAKIFLEKLIKS